MRLYYSPASPYARKCRVLLREKGLAGRVEEVRLEAMSADPAFLAVSPLGQVPALVDEAGAAWIDSPLICARIDAMTPAPRFIPDGEARWDALARETLADGAMELGVKLRLEQIRPEGERSPSWMARWREGLLRALKMLEARAAPNAGLDIGAVAAVCALTWIDFRHADVNWRGLCPKLAALQEAVEQRASFRETKPA